MGEEEHDDAMKKIEELSERIKERPCRLGGSYQEQPNERMTKEEMRGIEYAIVNDIDIEEEYIDYKQLGIEAEIIDGPSE